MPPSSVIVPEYVAVDAVATVAAALDNAEFTLALSEGVTLFFNTDFCGVAKLIFSVMVYTESVILAGLSARVNCSITLSLSVVSCTWKLLESLDPSSPLGLHSRSPSSRMKAGALSLV